MVIALPGFGRLHETKGTGKNALMGVDGFCPNRNRRGYLRDRLFGDRRNGHGSESLSRKKIQRALILDSRAFKELEPDARRYPDEHTSG